MKTIAVLMLFFVAGGVLGCEVKAALDGATASPPPPRVDPYACKQVNGPPDIPMWQCCYRFNAVRDSCCFVAKGVGISCQ